MLLVLPPSRIAAFPILHDPYASSRAPLPSSRIEGSEQCRPCTKRCRGRLDYGIPARTWSALALSFSDLFVAIFPLSGLRVSNFVTSSKSISWHLYLGGTCGGAAALGAATAIGGLRPGSDGIGTMAIGAQWTSPRQRIPTVTISQSGPHSRKERSSPFQKSVAAQRGRSRDSGEFEIQLSTS